MKTKRSEPKIEHGIPIPTARGHWQTILRKLKVGDSVVLPIVAPNAYTSARRALGEGKFMVRKVEGGVRIWRTK